MRLPDEAALPAPTPAARFPAGFDFARADFTDVTLLAALAFTDRMA